VEKQRRPVPGASEPRVAKSGWWGARAASAVVSGCGSGGHLRAHTPGRVRSSQATRSLALGTDWGAGGSGGFSAALMLGEMRD